MLYIFESELQFNVCFHVKDTHDCISHPEAEYHFVFISLPPITFCFQISSRK